MTTRPSARLRSGAAACGLLLLAALGLRRPELVAVAAPLGLALVWGAARARPPGLEIGVRLSDLRLVEGEEVAMEVTLRSPTGLDQLELELRVPAGLAAVGELPLRRLRLAPGETRTLRQRYACRRWGGAALGVRRAVARDRLGLFAYGLPPGDAVPLRVYPATEPLRARPRPHRPQLSVGGDVARVKGEGIEHADIRPFAPGDRVRRVNWRMTARRGRPYVNEHHPERNADVVLFVDSFGDESGWAAGPLDQAVRATAALAALFLEHRDRVGVVGFGGVLRWVLPGGGATQTYRILDSLIDTQIVVSAAWRGVEVIPARTLPPAALVLAVTPLVDERTLAALANLRGRGFDLAVVEIAPDPFLPPATADADRLALRLWQLRRERIRSSFGELGAPVVTWSRDAPLDAALAVLGEARRWARFASR